MLLKHPLELADQVEPADEEGFAELKAAEGVEQLSAPRDNANGPTQKQ